MKKVLIVITTIIAVLGIAAGVYLAMRPQDIREQAAPATLLTLNPDKTNGTVGDSIPVFVDIQPNSNAVSAVTLEINYNPSVLSITAADLEQGTLFANTVELEKVVDSTNGLILYSMYFQAGTTPTTTAGRVAILNFDAVGEGTSDITFKFTPGSTTEGTIVTAAGETGNVLQSVQNTSITIGGAPQITATPTANPTDPTQTPTATPTTPADDNDDDEDNDDPAVTATPTPKPTATDAPTKGGLSTTSTPMPLPDSGVSSYTIVAMLVSFFLISTSLAFIYAEKRS